MKEIYLDNASTTKPNQKVVEVILDALTINYGNPSSLHKKGIEAEKIIENTRDSIAKFLQVKPSEIYFTSGGTESNNLAIKGTVQAMKKYGNHLITTQIEHTSVLEVFKQLEKEGFEVTYLNVDNNGIIDTKELINSLRDDTILVSIMYVNNEVGSVQPIEEISKMLKNRKNTVFHIDAVQAFGKIKLIPRLEGIDLLTISAHKIYGSKGVGGLFVRTGTKIQKLFDGGSQERGLRPGTENVAAISGFGKAVELVNENFENWSEKMKTFKIYLKNKIIEQIDNVVVNSPEDGAPHILNVSFLGVRGEILVHSLESKGIFVSTTSACNSKNGVRSHVLKAMGKSKKEMDGAIRFSFSPFLSFEDLDYTVEVLKKEVSEIRRYVRD